MLSGRCGRNRYAGRAEVLQGYAVSPCVHRPASAANASRRLTCVHFAHASPVPSSCRKEAKSPQITPSHPKIQTALSRQPYSACVSGCACKGVFSAPSRPIGWAGEVREENLDSRPNCLLINKYLCSRHPSPTTLSAGLCTPAHLHTEITHRPPHTTHTAHNTDKIEASTSFSRAHSPHRFFWRYGVF